MPSLRFSLVWLVLAAVLSVTFIDRVSALNAVYCSTINTSSDNKNISIYQSNGLCHDFCDASSAFAILQGNGCWCSDYVPSTTTSLGDCDFSCPGFPSDLCGGSNLYGYFALDKAAAGTKGGSTPTSAKSTAAAPEQVTVTASAKPVTVTATPPLSSSTSSSSVVAETKDTSTTFSTSSSSSSSSSSKATWTPTPVVSIQTVTGQVQTITYTPTTPPNTAANNAALSKSGKNKLSTGQAVGLTIGLVALAALAAIIAFLCIRRRRKQQRLEAESNLAGSDLIRRGSSSTGPLPQRTMSENSRFMLQTDGRQVVEGYESESGTPGSRVSRLLPVDPRLDPFAGLYQRNDNKSRESVQTIQDNQDYSRRVIQTKGPILRATNPD